MKMKWKTLFFVGAIAALLPGLAHSEDDLSHSPNESYLNTFFSTMGESFQFVTTNEPPWQLPEIFESQGTNWTTQAIEDNGRELLFSVSTPGGLTNISVWAYYSSSNDSIRHVLSSAINIPCNFPAAMLASAFSVERLGQELIILCGPRPGYNGNYCFLVCRNLVLTIPALAGNGKNLALSLLRAGGVDIPAEPESPEPNPE